MGQVLLKDAAFYLALAEELALVGTDDDTLALVDQEADIEAALQINTTGMAYKLAYASLYGQVSTRFFTSAAVAGAPSFTLDAIAGSFDGGTTYKVLHQWAPITISGAAEQNAVLLPPGIFQPTLTHIKFLSDVQSSLGVGTNSINALFALILAR